jgi:predicted acylesterase/phospholipase RssA
MEQLNKSPGNDISNVRQVDVAERIARLARTHLSDSYVDSRQVSSWLEAMGNSDAIQVLLNDLRQAKLNRQDPEPIYARLAAGPVGWGVPAPPRTTAPLKIPASAAEASTELDAERFLANATGLASSLLALETLIGRGPLDAKVLQKGIATGAARAAAYITARSWHRRVGRPATAIVLSGGAANGAFSAGVMWRLLKVLSGCRSVPEDQGGCSGVHLDLVAGTSTGALIGSLTDLYFTGPPRSENESRALDLMMGRYTCSVASDLYCVNNTWIWRLFSDVRGLVQFDGVEKLLRDNITPDVSTNSVEMVSVSIDYETGDVFANSDQDPADSGPPERRLQGTLASIVEPVLAEPVDGLPSASGMLRGTYVDGGVRSGLPVLQAVYRGAERVLVLTNSGIEPGRASRQRSTLDMLLRTLDLFGTNPNVAEVQLAELTAVERRFLEYNVCKIRLSALASKERATVEDFCRRTTGFERKGPGVAPHLQAAETAWLGPARFPQVATSWQSSWLFRPEEDLATAAGYSFDAAVTQPLFLAGVRSFQDRCGEILDLLDVRGELARTACEEKDAVDKAKSLLTPIDKCRANREKLRRCD